MANDDGTFGFEGLQKAFNRIEQKYENKTDAMLMAMANTARQRVRSKTPTGKTKKLKGSWRTKKPKTFGKARVARVQTENRYGHVVEEVEGLEYHTNLGAVQGQLFEDLHNILTAVLNVTTGGMLQKVHAANQRGLTATGGADDANNITLMNVKADSLEDFPFAKGLL